MEINWFDNYVKSEARLFKNLYKYMESIGIFGDDFIIFMRSKYSYEKEWDYHTEILELHSDQKDPWMWNIDWYEGQEDVEFIGFIYMSDLEEYITTEFKKKLIK